MITTSPPPPPSLVVVVVVVVVVITCIADSEGSPVSSSRVDSFSMAKRGKRGGGGARDAISSSLGRVSVEMER